MKTILLSFFLLVNVSLLFGQSKTTIITVHKNDSAHVQQIQSFDPFLETIVQSNYVTSKYHFQMAYESAYNPQNNTYIWSGDTIFRSQLGVTSSQQIVLPLDSPNHHAFRLFNIEYDTLNDFLVGFGAADQIYGVIYYCQVDLQQNTFVKKIPLSYPTHGTRQGNSTYDQVSGDIYVVGGHMGIRRYDNNGNLIQSIDEPNYFITSPEYDHQSKKLYCIYTENLSPSTATITFRYIDPIDGSNHIIDTIAENVFSSNFWYFLKGKVSIDELNRKYWVYKYGLIQSFDLYSGKRLDSIPVSYALNFMNGFEIAYEACDTNILTQPVPVITPLGTSAYFNSYGTFSNKEFEWQEFTDRGFTRIRDTINYQGIKSQNLIIPSVDSSDHYKLFRCKISQNGCNEYSKEVRLNALELMGLETPEINVSIFPNPSDGLITFNLNMAIKNGLQLNIYDVNGKIIDQYEVNGQSHTIDVSNYKNGVYFYEMLFQDQVKRGKIIKE